MPGLWKPRWPAGCCGHTGTKKTGSSRCGAASTWWPSSAKRGSLCLWRADTTSTHRTSPRTAIYLKAATRLALRVPRVDPEDRRRLLQQVASLEDVADEFMRADYLDRIPITRLNTHYQPALRLARLLLENLTLADQRGQHAASSFVVDMNRLFENFVTQRLRRALRGHLEVRSQSNRHLDTRQQVPIRPDLVFRKQGHEVYVADIKYKLTDDALARTSDYYQLLAYTTAMDLPEGVLIYCLADGGVPERTITVRHAGKLLHTLAIDLSGPPSEVTAAITEAATWIRQRVRSIRPLVAPAQQEPARSLALR